MSGERPDGHLAKAVANRRTPDYLCPYFGRLAMRGVLRRTGAPIRSPRGQVATWRMSDGGADDEMRPVPGLGRVLHSGTDRSQAARPLQSLFVGPCRTHVGSEDHDGPLAGPLRARP